MGLFGNKADHPMADIKSAQQLLKDVLRNDPLKALPEITDWIESVRDNADFHLDQRLDILNLLDEAARPLMRKLVREYFAVTTLSKFQENRTWMVLNEFFSQVEQAYFTVLNGYLKESKGSASIKPSLPLIAARGIHGVMGRLKCAAARYEPVEPAIWQHLAEYFSHAEAHHYLSEPVKLYASFAQHTSVRNKFVSVLMWYAPGSTTLSPLHMHLAERLTAYFCKYFTMDGQITTNSLFYFDLQHIDLPQRVTAETRPMPGMRFLGAGDAKSHLEALLKVLEKHIVPDEINLGGIYEADVVLDVARSLLNYWGAPAPMRRHARRQIKVNVRVAYGYSRVVECATDAGMADVDAPAWEVEDISATGFRCVMPSKYTEGIKIGLIIGIRPENVAYWGVAIVRRLSRDQQGSLHVGVEVLANQMASVGLSAHKSATADNEHGAIWLKCLGDNTGGVSLLMRPGSYSSSRSLNTRFEGKDYLLIPLALQEKGMDYDLAKYRTVEQETNAVSDTY